MQKQKGGEKEPVSPVEPIVRSWAVARVGRRNMLVVCGVPSLKPFCTIASASKKLCSPLPSIFP